MSYTKRSSRCDPCNRRRCQSRAGQIGTKIHLHSRDLDQERHSIMLRQMPCRTRSVVAHKYPWHPLKRSVLTVHSKTGQITYHIHHFGKSTTEKRHTGNRTPRAHNASTFCVCDKPDQSRLMGHHGPLDKDWTSKHSHSWQP